LELRWEIELLFIEKARKKFLEKNLILKLSPKHRFGLF
jgi:hypothetical protein